MTKNKYLIGVLSFLVVLLGAAFFMTGVSAQESETLTPNNGDDIFVPEVPLNAEAGDDRNVVVGRQVLFSGAASTGPVGEELEYSWDFCDGTNATGVDVTHVYRTSGIYRVTLTVSDAENAVTDEIIVSVDKDIVLLITDGSVSEESRQALVDRSSPLGILTVDLHINEAGGNYQAEANLVQAIIDNKDNISQASNIVVWTEENLGVNALITASQELTKTNTLDALGFQNKNIVILTEKSLGATARLAQNIYNLMRPQTLILSGNAAGEVAVTTLEAADLLQSLQDNDIGYQLLGVHTQRPLTQLKPWNFLSYTVNFMVNNGVPLNTVYLILILPVIATIIAFARQVIGVKALGLYAPSLVAVSFLATGLRYGLLIFVMVLLVGTLGRLAARKTRILYLPRMAIVLTLVSLSILLLFFVGAFWEINSVIAISIFPILIMVIITEKFISAQIEQGSKAAWKLVGETLILSIICYYLATWESFRVLLLGYPELIFITIVINFLFGRWVGLRLLETYRFRKVLKHVQLTEKK